MCRPSSFLSLHTRFDSDRGAGFRLVWRVMGSPLDPFKSAIPHTCRLQKLMKPSCGKIRSLILQHLDFQVGDMLGQQDQLLLVAMGDVGDDVLTGHVPAGDLRRRVVGLAQPGGEPPGTRLVQRPAERLLRVVEAVAPVDAGLRCQPAVLRVTARTRTARPRRTSSPGPRHRRSAPPATGRCSASSSRCLTTPGPAAASSRVRPTASRCR